MAVVKDMKVDPVRVPQHNINAYVRVPGRAATPLSKALQEWDGIDLVKAQVADRGTPRETRTEHRVYFNTEEGQAYIPVTEQIYEVALYTRATKRFTEWMKANGKG